MSLKKQFLKSKPVCKVTFSLPVEAANGAKKVYLVGEFNNWNVEKGIQMKRRKENYATTVELPVGKEYQFRYLLDNAIWTNDSEADSYKSTPFGVDNSVVKL